ncbi:hypothetical protein RJ640_027124 [Escallonia rubra]|uniref:SET domain-containing protein n=1 Tax=Escallonia rubra TaxID=112253 RepID=A0AA88QR34_9ASTE|nr:hypothetical protein RJ640_027124 [Escallonia rubra]
MASPEEAKLELFLHWLQLNGVELRNCKIKYTDSSKGFGIFSSNTAPDGVLLVVPLDLAITPMRVLQDPTLGPECSAMFEEGEVDDRYFDVLPTTFGNPLWFTNDEFLELKGTTLYCATELQKKKLQSLYDDKVKNLVQRLLILEGDSERANSIFWTRALNIPLPRSYVFPNVQEAEESTLLSSNGVSDNHMSRGEFVNGDDGKKLKVNKDENQVAGDKSTTLQGETVWVEGLVPGIDFCNHDLKAAATWEVDGTGSTTGLPFSMYLLSGSSTSPAEQSPHQVEKEVSISYGDKGNEELLYLYGFVIDNNPDDYIMVHYPADAIHSVPFSESKIQLLEAQKAEMRCLLPRSLLDRGFFPACTPKKGSNQNCAVTQVSNYSWSGQRKMPSYVNKLVFPEEFLTSLRTIAMRENELYQVSSLLEELVGSEGERQPCDTEVRAAIWEACGDSGALQLLVDLLNMKMMDLEEASGTENCDTELLEKTYPQKILEKCSSSEKYADVQRQLSRNKVSSIIYRRGQKQLCRLFLKEAEHALHLALSEGN